MRKIALAMFVVATPFVVTACHQQQDFNYTSADANDDAALNNLESEDDLAQGAGVAGAGMIPDENGHVPEANVQ